ncbi:MAG: helix-turn-helix transcriptional regulator, partial [Lentisphaerae bacterium]|nr:helix-turn-helix transcriptional regulator [Lentisphaerota bacterium]
RSALFRLFKRHFNTTPMDYIIKCRIENSCWYLANHSTSIRAIAQACGYDNPAFFSRTFKKIVGVSPSEFRRQRSTQHMVRAPNPRRH